MLNLEVIGQKIASLRRSKGMQQNQLAESLHVTHQAVSKWEKGKSIPSIDILYGLTKVFNVSIDYLLDDSEVKADDYETLLRIQPRESVIRKWMDTPCPESHLDQIFYLLTKTERQFVIKQIQQGYLNVSFNDVWYLLSKEERMHVLSLIKHGTLDWDTLHMRHHLSNDERRFLSSKGGKNESIK